MTQIIPSTLHSKVMRYVGARTTDSIEKSYQFETKYLLSHTVMVGLDICTVQSMTILCIERIVSNVCFEI